MDSILIPTAHRTEHGLYRKSTGFADPRGMKLLPSLSLAKLPTRQPRAAAADSPIALNRSPASQLEWFNFRDKLNVVSL